MNTNPMHLGNIQLPGAASGGATFNPEDLSWSAFAQMNSGGKDSWNSAGMPHHQVNQSALPSGTSSFYQFTANMPPRYHHQRAMMNPNQVSHYGGNVAREDGGIFSPEESAELLSSAPQLNRRLNSDPGTAATGQYEYHDYHRLSAHQFHDLPRRRQSDSSITAYPGAYGNTANFSSFAAFPEFTPEYESHGHAGFPGASGDASPRQRKRRTTDSGQGGVLCCQITDCLADLTEEKPYCRRYKLCRKCMNRNSLIVGGAEMRFCQQCSFLHYLSDFDGQKRSCREKLQKHALRVRKSRAAAAAVQAQAQAEQSSK